MQMKACCFALVFMMFMPAGLYGQEVLHTTAQELQSLFTMQNLGIATVGLGGAWLVSPWDDDVNERVDGNRLSTATKPFTKQYGRGIYVVPASLGLWGLSKALDHRPGQVFFSNLGRAVAFAELLVQPTKQLVGRRRPDGSNKRSFPSGHTGNSFAIARVMQRQYGYRVGLPFYLAAGLVGANRLERNVHHLSDVVAGAAFGIIAGSMVHLADPGRVSLSPTRLGPTWALKVQARF